MANQEVLNQKDGLTGYHTKQGLFEYLSSKTQSVYNRPKNLAVILLDLDKFKPINDTYGHLIGDDALRHFCMAINKALKGKHFVARYGGDEFVIVCDDDASGKESLEIAKRVKTILKREKFFTPKGHIRIRSSIGISHYPEDAKTGRGLLDRADQALYYAKQHGRDQAVSTRSLRKYSAKNRFFSLAKLALIFGIVAIIFLSYYRTNTLRGISAYFKNLFQQTSFTRHQKKRGYNFATLRLKDGKKISGWIISEDEEKITMTMTKPEFHLNPLRMKVAAEPLIVPKSQIIASITVSK